MVTPRPQFYGDDMTVSARPPVAEVRIDADLVTRLLRAHVPEAQQFALGDHHQGRDAVVWRLGADWAVRLPHRQLAADRQSTELDWLPHLCAGWPFRAPVPVRIGRPTQDYPWRWSIVPWVQGVPMTHAPLSLGGAAQLGHALRALHTPAPAQAPRHPRWSQPLRARAARTEDRLATLVRRTEVGSWRLDIAAAHRIIEAGAALPVGAPRWCHLDVRAEHIMTANGYLAGIIDWGDAAAADPAHDLGQALVTLPVTAWDAFITGYGGLEPHTFTRARAAAIEFAASLALTGNPTHAHAGWTGLAALGVAHRAD